jgi:meso-butanediol dehydrogenase / (S,S)-butanediol dehydrogenase / diacetyl reductase
MVAVVTGASKGLGRGIAIALAAGGYDVVIGYRSADTDAKQTATLVDELGRRSVIVAGDVSETDTHLALAAAADELGRVDVWVNNAGVSTLAPVVATDERDFRHMIDVNLVGTFLGLRTAVTAMRAHGKGGRIVNIASELGVQAFPYLGAYSATKFAVVGLTQAAALELAPEHITVNAVCPGTAETDMVAAERMAEAALTAQSLDAVRDSYLAGIPSGRFCAPDDVGALVAYLASPGAAYVTGQSICVNGGSVLR